LGFVFKTKKMKYFRFAVALTIVLIGATLQTKGQEKGFLRGNVSDGEIGGPMIGANVVLADNPSVGTITDFDGNYSLPLDPGTYNIKISFISFVSQTFTDVVIKPGEVTIIDTELKPAVDELAAVEIVAEARRNTETAVLMDMKNATGVMDGLSVQSIRKIGDSDLSGAIKRVTGVTVQDGKYVYVRGLGDRYTKTTLNGMAIPGLDPDVNAVAIDIFPTSVLENVAVFKSFTPNQYGDFTGGLVNVVTKNFPDVKETQVRLGVGYVFGQTFNNDFILYDRGGTDWLGFDDGTRELPINKNTVIPLEPLNDPELERITRSFNSTLATSQANALMNTSLSFRHGNQINKENGETWGYNFVLNYRNNNNFYEDFEANTFLKPAGDSADENELFRDEQRIGVVGRNEVQWSALASGAYKKGNSDFNAMILHSQSAETSASKRRSTNFNQTQARLVEDILTFTQRSLTTFMIGGRHQVDKLNIEWRNALTRSRVYDPDFRTTAYSITTGDTTLNTGDGAGIDRFWRDLNEINENFRVDLTYEFNKSFKLLAGGNALLKWRDFETLAYGHDRVNKTDVVGDPDWFLQDENIWTTSDNSGTFTIGNFEPINTFEARQNVFAGYLMGENRIFGNMRAIYGVRVEQGSMFYTGVTGDASEALNDAQTLDELNFLPSLNLVYELTEKMNLRGSYTQTLARPSFKEKSNAQIFDPITKRTFVGNIDLDQTEIQNYDLRWEWFLGPRELISVAAFYKQFDGHIELVAFETAPDNLKPRNAGSANVTGIEVELRKSLGFLAGESSKILNRFFIGGNLTLVQSEVDMREVNTGNEGQTEYDLRQDNLRPGETLDFFRDMAGQSPYAINANLTYEIIEKQFNVSVAYNVQGEQLTVIASGRRPDVYTIPFHSLDFNAYFSFGEKLNSRIVLGLNNILDDDRTLVYRSFGSQDQIFQSFRPGTTARLSYVYSF
jgi:TonB-dependent receptor